MTRDRAHTPAAMSTAWRPSPGAFALAPAQAASDDAQRRVADVAGPRTRPAGSCSSTAARSAHPRGTGKRVARDRATATSWPGGVTSSPRTADESVRLAVTALRCTAQAERPRRGVERVRPVMDVLRSEAHVRGVRKQFPIAPGGRATQSPLELPAASRPLQTPRAHAPQQNTSTPDEHDQQPAGGRSA